jgi:transglutaminase-like putative cysteine protease
MIDPKGPCGEWQDFDPTYDMLPADQHITTAWVRDYSDVTPLKSVVFGGGGKQVLTLAGDVSRVEFRSENELGSTRRQSDQSQLGSPLQT